MKSVRLKEEKQTEVVTLCSFQPRVVYDEIVEKGSYRLPRGNFIQYAKINQSYKPHRILEKYDRLIGKSGLDFKEQNTMPIWAWHKEDGGQIVSPKMYDGALERARERSYVKEKYPEMVGLFLHVPKDEVYLTNFLQWDFYLFNEVHDEGIKDFDNWTQEEKGWYMACVAEEDFYFSNLDEIEGNVEVQGIFREIREDMIFHVIIENKKNK